MTTCVDLKGWLATPASTTRICICRRWGWPWSRSICDDTTLVYELKAPFSELLFQLTRSFATVIEKPQVEKLGPDFGVQGMNRAGPFGGQNWTPRDKLSLTKHAGYKCGPAFYKNKSEAQVDRIVWQLVPKENAPSRCSPTRPNCRPILLSPRLSSCAPRPLSTSSNPTLRGGRFHRRQNR